MSKFKRALSMILAIAMVFGSLSCLGAVVAPKASAAEGTSKVDSLASLDAAYDNYVYFGTEFYEIDITKNADGTLGAASNHVLTDYYVDAGQYLEARLYLKSDMYLGEGTFFFLYENDFFDVKQLTNAVPANPNGYTQGQAGGVNANHPAYKVNKIKGMQTSENAYSQNWMKQRTGYTQAELESWDYSSIVTAFTDNGQNQAYLFNSDEYIFSWFVKVRDDVTEGDSGSTFTKPGFWKCDDYDPTVTKQTGWNGRQGNFTTKVRPAGATADDDFNTLLTDTKNAFLNYGVYEHVFFEDLEHTFTVGKNPNAGGGDTPSEPEGPVAGTSKIDSLASLDAAYNNYVYFGTEFYEIDITKNADGTLGEASNHILTDYYVDAGQYLEARLYLKSDMYLGEGTFFFLYENDFFDVKQLTNAVPANPNGYTQGQAGGVNANHPAYKVNKIKGMQTSENAYSQNWMKQRTGYTQAELESWDYSSIVTAFTDNGQNQAYLFNSDEYIFSWFVKVRDDVTEGDSGSTFTKPGFWKCDDYDPTVTKQTGWNGRQGNFTTKVRPAGATADDDFNTLLTDTKNAFLNYGVYEHVFFEDLEHTFTCGKRPAAGSKTATFVVDGETYDSATYAAGDEIAAPAVNPGKEGYEFKGWALEGTTDILTFPQTMGNANVTYVAIFTEVAKYTAKFVVDGVTVSEAEYATGAAIEAPADPSKTGYNFAGWSPAVGTMGSADITFNATWTAKSYTVTYINGDATHQTLPVSFDNAYTLPVEPGKLGHEFAGWVDAQGNAMPAKHTVDANVTYYAKWNAGTYTATFKANGGVFAANGSDTYTVDVVFGQKITAPAAPTKTGNNFLGWTPEVGNMTAEGMTFTAQWEAAKIAVYFMDGDTLIEPKEGEYGSDISAISNPSKDGYTFAGWVDANGAPVQFPITLGTEAVYVYAKWNAKPYYIEFYGYNGSSANDWISGEEQLCGAAIATPELMDYKGYTFIGWFDADGNPMPETVPAIQNQAYYAKYEAIKYVATFDAAGGQFADGNGTATYEGIYNSTIVKPANPTKEGYTFSKWSPTPPNRMPANNVTYTAQWTINSYKINYYVDGALVWTDTYQYGADVTAWTYVPAEGVSFGGWGDQVPATMPANDVNVYGTTGVNTYNAIFTIDGEVYATVPVAFGAAITAPDYDVPAGYTFSGWSVDATMPAHDVTYNATLTANTYNAIFYLDEAKTQVYKTVPTVFGEEIAFPADPTMDGKEFDSWDNDATVMEAGDMEFVAIWNDIEYYIEFYNAEGDIIAEDYLFWGDEITFPEDPTLEGHEFKYWTVNGKPVTAPATVNGDLVAEGSNSITFEPYFSIIGYDVIYMVDGEVYKTETYEFGADIEILADLVKEGYTFSGWDTELPATMPAYDITVNGTFTVNQYDALFYVDGALVATVPTNFGETPVAPDVADAKPGYTFQGWNPALAAMTTAGASYNAVFTAAGDTPYTVEIYIMDTEGNYDAPIVENLTGATDTTATYNPEAKTGFTIDAASVLEGTITADGKLVLKVYYIRNQYTFKTVVDGAEETATYYYDEAVTAPADPAKTGYTFTGWDGDVPATMPAKDVTLTATWQINQYTISFVDTGDVAYDDITLDYNAEVGTVKEPVKTGYTFAGWDKEIPANMPAEDTVITATWTINQYTITFVDTGDVAYDAITQDYATDIDDIADPVKTGYTFTGWDVEIPATMPATNVTITATWTVNYYNATFVINGVETVKSTAYGTMPEIPDATRVGYTFDGWDKEVTTMPAEDVVYTALYTANTYDAIFDADGGKWTDGETSKAVATVFDTAIIAPTEDPTREGYVFAGWDPTVGNMTAEGMTFKALWTQDLNYCRVQLVTRTTAGVTNARLAAYDIKVMESPIKVQIACTDGSGFTWTYDRNDYKVPGDLTTSGLVAVKGYTAEGVEITDGSTPAYEIWTIVTVITEGDYKVRAKVDYSSTSWENIDLAYDYHCEYEESTTDESKIISVDVAAPAVKRGTVNPVTIVTTDDVSRLRITMSLDDGTERIVSYSQTSTVVDYTNNGDGTATWVLNIKFTYSGTADEQVQNWTLWYRATGDKAWNETQRTFEVKVTRYEPVEETPDATYAPFTVVSVKAEETAVKAKYTPIVIVTTSDATKVRINNQNGKATTYMQTSNNVTYADNGDGTATWTINYRFADLGEQTWGVQCRGNAWSTIDAASSFTITINAA